MDIHIRSEQLNDYARLVDLYYNHVALIKQDKKTRKCPRADYAKEIVTKHAALLKATLDKPMRQAIVSSSDKQLIAEDNWQDLKFMNPHRILPCQEATLRALEAYKIPLRDISAFTVIDQGYETSSTIFMKEAAALKKCSSDIEMNFDAIKKEFQKGLLGYSYIGVMEFAIFDEEKYEDEANPENNGWLICPHLQGLIWKDDGLTTADNKHLNKEFATGGRWDAAGFMYEKIWDVTGSVSYMHKLPLFAYTNTYRHSSKALSQDSAFVMFQRLKNIDFEKLFISGGEGQNVRTIVLNYLKEHYQEYN